MPAPMPMPIPMFIPAMPMFIPPMPIPPIGIYRFMPGMPLFIIPSAFMVAVIALRAGPWPAENAPNDGEVWLEDEDVVSVANEDAD